MANKDNVSMEESESDNGGNIGNYRVNAFGEPKTSRHNRPPHSKKILEKQERVPTCKSKCISAMHKAKINSQDVSRNICHKCSLQLFTYI